MDITELKRIEAEMLAAKKAKEDAERGSYIQAVENIAAAIVDYTQKVPATEFEYGLSGNLEISGQVYAKHNGFANRCRKDLKTCLEVKHGFQNLQDVYVFKPRDGNDIAHDSHGLESCILLCCCLPCIVCVDGYAMTHVNFRLVFKLETNTGASK